MSFVTNPSPTLQSAASESDHVSLQSGAAVESSTRRALLPLPMAGADRSRAAEVSGAASLLRGIVGDSPGVFAITARGHSMRDALVGDGDVVLLQETARVRDGEQAAVRISGGEIVLRRVSYEGNTVRAQPENGRMPAEIMAPEDLTIVGRVVAIVRQDPRTRDTEWRGTDASQVPDQAAATARIGESSSAIWAVRRVS